jgi:hypothetical protein
MAGANRARAPGKSTRQVRSDETEYPKRRVGCHGTARSQRTSPAGVDSACVCAAYQASNRS